MVVTYECIAAQAWNLHRPVRHELRNKFMGKLFPLLPYFTTNKDKIHEERLIANDCFSVMWTNSHNYCFFMSIAVNQRFLNSYCIGE